MRPKWDNLFWFEHGEGDATTQLENNTTKSLLKTLQEVDSEVETKLLREAVGDSSLPEGATVSYDTQIPLAEIPQSGRTLHLLGLSYNGTNVGREAPPREGSGRVDGVIDIDTDEASLIVVVEVKTGRDQLTKQQLGKYRGTLGIDPDHCHGLSWLKVWELFDEVQSTVSSDLDQLLVSEFADYLELMDMVPFQGFDRTELRKPTSTDYKRSLMRGMNQQSPGALAQALYDARGEYGFEDFTVVSNQASTQLHLIEQKHDDADRSTYDVNHYTVGFWRGRLNFQINIRRRILSTVTEQGSESPTSEFSHELQDALEATTDTSLTTAENPLTYVRYHGNIPQEHDDLYRPSTFALEEFAYSSEMTDQAGIRDRVEILAKTIREANDAGIVSSPAFVVEKQLPYGSPLIEDKDLPDYALEFFEELHDIYELFSQ